MVTVWEWVGAVLLTYGVIIFLTGLYLLYRPHTSTELHHLYPNLWWGGVMIMAGLIFLVFPRRAGSD